MGTAMQKSFGFTDAWGDCLEPKYCIPPAGVQKKALASQPLSQDEVHGPGREGNLTSFPDCNLRLRGSEQPGSHSLNEF